MRQLEAEYTCAVVPRRQRTECLQTRRGPYTDARCIFIVADFIIIPNFITVWRRRLMATSAKGKQARLANKALYAPRPKPPPERPHPKAPERHLVGDEVLKKIIQRVLAELKLPGKIP